MNILIVPGSGNIDSKDSVFLKHVEGWAKLNNSVYVIGSHHDTGTRVSNISYIQRPSVARNNLFLSLWFYFINHPRIDLIINKFSIIPFVVPRSQRIIYLNEVPKKRLIANFLLKFLYKRNYFLVIASQIRDYLLKNGVKPNKIFLLEKSLVFHTSKTRVKGDFSKKILFVDSKNLGETYAEALKVFEKIDRRQEGWKYKLIVNKENYDKVKEALSKIETPSNFTVLLKKSTKTTIRELSKVGLLMDVETSSDSLQNDLLAIYSQVPVLGYKSINTKDFPGIEKVILSPLENDSQEMANLAMDFSTNLALERKLKLNCQTFLSLYSWENLVRRSLNFLESM